MLARLDFRSCEQVVENSIGESDNPRDQPIIAYLRGVRFAVFSITNLQDGTEGGRGSQPIADPQECVMLRKNGTFHYGAGGNSSRWRLNSILLSIRFGVKLRSLPLFMRSRLAYKGSV